ncbi:MAG: hypothetical protein R3F29_09700 [Planctomycetota bacterium]
MDCDDPLKAWRATPTATARPIAQPHIGVDAGWGSSPSASKSSAGSGSASTGWRTTRRRGEFPGTGGGSSRVIRTPLHNSAARGVHRRALRKRPMATQALDALAQ